MITNAEAYLKEYKGLIDRALVKKIEAIQTTQKLKEAMLYSVKAGGKRLRPILLMAVVETLGKDPMLGLDPGCSLEMLHTYSLIHDDLPAMDDDDLRRGMPTNHIVFGEATAILAGDGLLTQAFECLAQASGLTSDQKIELIQLLANASGPEGMVAGQSDDLESEDQKLSIEDLERIHRRKTGRLLEYAVEAGAVIAHCDDQVRHHLKMYARHLGIAFQIKDDLLDVEGDAAVIGKPIGSDAEKGKNTYPSLLTVEGAKAQLKEHFEKALRSLRLAGLQVGILDELARYIIVRDH
jgi:geranylgeranyl diphosphate synthase type II